MRGMKYENLAIHFSSLARLDRAIETFKGLYEEIPMVKRQLARVDAAADANLACAMAGLDTTETQAELDQALNEVLEFEDGFWVAAVRHLNADTSTYEGQDDANA